jgi:DNA-directed RNA polymerase subunit RPC12/RpoP
MGDEPNIVYVCGDCGKKSPAGAPHHCPPKSVIAQDLRNAEAALSIVEGERELLDAYATDYREALERLRNGPDTLTPAGLRIVIDALSPPEGEKDGCPTCGTRWNYTGNRPDYSCPDPFHSPEGQG